MLNLLVSTDQNHRERITAHARFVGRGCEEAELKAGIIYLVLQLKSYNQINLHLLVNKGRDTLNSFKLSDTIFAHV